MFLGTDCNKHLKYQNKNFKWVTTESYRIRQMLPRKLT